MRRCVAIVVAALLALTPAGAQTGKAVNEAVEMGRDAEIVIIESTGQ